MKLGVKPKKPDGSELARCSFCGKSQKRVRKLIAGPGVYICDECVGLCDEIIAEELAHEGAQGAAAGKGTAGHRSSTPGTSRTPAPRQITVEHPAAPVSLDKVAEVRRLVDRLSALLGELGADGDAE